MRYLLWCLALAAALALMAVGCSEDRDQLQAPPLGPLTSVLDGSETLGLPSIPIASGTGAVCAGIGMFPDQDGTLSFSVPFDATVMQVILYWEGQHSTPAGDDQVTVDGNSVTGTLIGGPNFFYAPYSSSTYRADITGLDLVGPGANSLLIEDMDFEDKNSGAGIFVIYTEPGETSATIMLRDGNDLAWIGFPEPRMTCVPQTFDFEAALEAREANAALFFGSITSGRPSLLRWWIDGVEQPPMCDVMSMALDGPEWTHVVLPLTIPAGATSLTLEPVSDVCPSSPYYPDGNPQSFAWVAAALSIETPITEIGCRMTGGGNDTFDGFDVGPANVYSFGGQAGAPLASPPQPWGEWTHTQKRGVAGSFTFHAGTASAPPGTEIDWIVCSDPGWCVQARPAPVKQLDFAGVGTFKNMKNVPTWISDYVVVGESFHWFEVNIDDLGEPGRAGKVDPPMETCDPWGYGRNGGTELADCDCPDFYRIRIYQGPSDTSPIMYEVYGYIDGGNLQIHPPTGRDRQDNIETQGHGKNR